MFNLLFKFYKLFFLISADEMSWFSSKKKNNIPDPKLISAASIPVDQELNTDDGKIKDDELKNKQKEPTKKKSRKNKL